jgi:hypothetical protein
MLETIKKMMAKRCDSCPLCSYARKNPESLIGRAVAFHGKFCPFWRCWEAEYGDKQQSAK